MSIKLFSLFGLVVFFIQNVCAMEEKPIVLVVTSYNNSQWYKKNLDAAFAQNYSNWRMIYVDDCSPDGTGDLVEKYIDQNGWEDKVTLIKNKDRKFKMYNFFYAIHEHCQDNEIVFDYDGDDMFAQNDALSIVNKAYQDSDVWMTYGTYKDSSGADGFCDVVPEWVVTQGAYRDYKWVTSQQRTFYSWLFKLIKVEDFLYEGKFIRAANDLAYMFPMLEMAGGRFEYIRDIIYIYNTSSPINNYKDKELRPHQLKMDKYTRNQRERYKKIQNSQC